MKLGAKFEQTSRFLEDLKRWGTFQSLPDLIRAIKDYLENYNQNPQVFVWSAPVERILEKYTKCKEVLDSLR